MASLEELRNTRLQKLALLKERGIHAYPITTSSSDSIKDVLEAFPKFLKKKKPTALSGRIMSVRPHGGLVFFNFTDGTETFQGLLKKGETPDDIVDLFLATVDVGDFVEVLGTFFITKREEKTLLVSNWKMLSKSLRPLPEKWQGLQDVEERFRRRYLDTLMSPEVRQRFLLRSQIVSHIRTILNKKDFLEVETPILQPIAGGASAEPFKTRHYALNIDMYLRIAPELYLKQLLIGGFPRVYEIGRSFRNEGIDVTHNPEFTTVEWYEAYSDAKKQMVFVENVLKSIVKETKGAEVISFLGQTIDFSKPFAVVSYFEILQRYALIANPESITKEELLLKASQLGIKTETGDGVEKIMDTIYKKLCRPKLIQPTFIVDYPVNYLPLAKKKEGSETLVDAFQVVIGGMEICKAFSELNDPIDQKERFSVQEKNRKAGDLEAQPTDTDFIEALEYGMPPTGGVGLSIDRMTMLLSDTKNIREVIFFPTLKPKTQ